MAGVKISALPVIPSSQLTDVAPFVQSGTTFKASNSQLIALYNANIVLSSVAQVTGLPADLAALLPLAGGTMTGNLILNGPATLPNQAVTFAQLETVAGGFTVILAAQAATTVNLNATQAGAGIGATLTNAGTQAAFAVDGYSASVNDRILVKNQTLTQHNGVYAVTTLGSGSTNWVLTRTTDYDTAAQIKPGTLIAVNNGTINATTSWLETATVVTVDTDPVLFSQFTFAPGQFLQVANNLSDVANTATARTNLGLTAAATMTLPVSGANGGTGVANTGSTITIGGNVTFAGAFTFSGTLTGNTAVTFPTSGTLLTSAQPTINQPNIVGVTNNAAASAGSVGELITSIIASGSAVSLVSNTAKNVTSISLSAGDWDVWGNVGFPGNGVTTIGQTRVWISSTSATSPDLSLYNGESQTTVSPAASKGYQTPSVTFQLNGATTIYLSCLAVFSGGAQTACGGIYARRRR
jgi:hypothetical protein